LDTGAVTAVILVVLCSAHDADTQSDPSATENILCTHSAEKIDAEEAAASRRQMVETNFRCRWRLLLKGGDGAFLAGLVQALGHFCLRAFAPRSYVSVPTTRAVLYAHASSTKHTKQPAFGALPRELV
jgi:hypothetical protein